MARGPAEQQGLDLFFLLLRVQGLVMISLFCADV